MWKVEDKREAGGFVVKGRAKGKLKKIDDWRGGWGVGVGNEEAVIRYC